VYVQEYRFASCFPGVSRLAVPIPQVGKVGTEKCGYNEQTRAWNDYYVAHAPAALYFLQGCFRVPSPYSSH
jgi:hypothetical protein